VAVFFKDVFPVLTGTRPRQRDCGVFTEKIGLPSSLELSLKVRLYKKKRICQDLRKNILPENGKISQQSNYYQSNPSFIGSRT
jgi:hypothetical protein